MSKLRDRRSTGVFGEPSVGRSSLVARRISVLFISLGIERG